MREIPRSVEREFRTLDLGDERREQRARRIVSTFLMAPEASIPVACGSDADTKAAYRFLSSDVSPQALQDKTNLDFTCCPGTAGLGPLDSLLCRGLKVQTMFLLEETGVPLGVVDQRVWARAAGVGKRQTRMQRVPEGKESWYWREGFDAVQERVPADVEIVGIADRESDIYFVLAMPRREGMHLLVRSAHNRAWRARSTAACARRWKPRPWRGSTS